MTPGVSRARFSCIGARDLIHRQLVGDAVASGGYVVLVADEEMRFLAASDGAVALLGYTREEITQLTVPDIVVDRREAEAQYTRFVREGLQRGETTLRTKDGLLVGARYEASDTVVAGLKYYVSVLFPN